MLFEPPVQGSIKLSRSNAGSRAILSNPTDVSAHLSQDDLTAVHLSSARGRDLTFQSRGGGSVDGLATRRGDLATRRDDGRDARPSIDELRRRGGSSSRLVDTSLGTTYSFESVV